MISSLQKSSALGLFGIFVVISTLLPDNLVSAQTVGQCWRTDQNLPMSVRITEADCKSLISSGSKVEWRIGPQVPASAEAEAQVTPATKADKSSCGALNMWQCFIDILLFAPGWIAQLILQLSTLIVWISGAVLNYAVNYSVVEMKEHLNAADSVNNAWRVIRDVANMGFIFVLLYASIKTIIGQGKDTKGLIVRIVVVAVLINFSLFFTKIVIDISNVLAMLFYNAIAPNAGIHLGINVGLADSLMKPLQMQSIFDSVSKYDGSKLFIVGVMGTIFCLIAAFVFFAVAIMFIIRFVVLMFVLVLSPIAFVAFILPDAGKYQRQWIDALIGQAFFAPIYFLLTWIVIAISGGVLKTTGSFAGALVGSEGEVGQAIAASPTDMGVLVNFMIMIAMLITSLTIAKEWSGKAGSGVQSLTKWATGAAGSTTLGIAGRFSRGTLGRVGQQVADSEYLKGKPGSMIARLGLAAGRKTAGASFDFRNTGISNQLGTGKGNKGGFTDDMKMKIDEEKKYADNFKPSDLVVARAEKELSEAKKSNDLARVATAQTDLDRISGATEDTLRQRKLKELRARGMGKKQARAELDKLEDERLQEINRLTEGGMSQDEAEKTATVGWAPKPEKGLANTRKEAYATDRATPARFSITGRVGVVGKIKKERLAIANAIRKSIKEKKPADKLAEEISKAQETADSTGETTTPPPTPPADAPPTQAGPSTP